MYLLDEVKSIPCHILRNDSEHETEEQQTEEHPEEW